MHLSYYFLSQLALELKEKLVGRWLAECFTQNKDEVVLGFAKEGEDFYIKCQLAPSFQCLTFHHDFKRAKANSMDLFAKAGELQVKDVQVTNNDRSFSILFEKDVQMLFKMHRNKSNIVIFQHSKGLDQFHKSYPDLSLQPENLAKNVAFDMDALIASDFDFKTYLPALGKEPLAWLKDKGFEEAAVEEKTEQVCQLLEILQYPSEFYVVEKNNEAILTFFKTEEEPLATCATAIEVSNAFQRLYYNVTQKAKQKNQASTALEDKKTRLVRYLKDLDIKLSFLSQSKQHEQTGDILMANLHALPSGVEKVTLFDFYENQEREIKLKKDLSPQKNAEYYYQKAKNSLVEKEHLLKTQLLKQQELERVEEEIRNAAVETSFTSSVKKKKANEEETSLPYKKFEWEGFEIRVGKNSQKNDELTLKYSSKNDLWMHARGYAGSHVIVKSKPGKIIPNSVIEKAASIAAWYSKGKTDSLCPVIVTEKKYVRKSKGMAPGQVTIEKEKVIMVTPSSF